jgi:hypothetical protein
LKNHYLLRKRLECPVFTCTRQARAWIHWVCAAAAGLSEKQGRGKLSEAKVLFFAPEKQKACIKQAFCNFGCAGKI